MAGKKVKNFFPERFQLLLDNCPYSQACIAKMLQVAESTLCKWSSGETTPGTVNLIRLSHILLDVEPKYLVGITNMPFSINGLSIEDVVMNMPQGEQALSPCAMLIAKKTQKACSIYRYWPEENNLVLASFFRYILGLKTKFRYRLADDKSMGDGVTGNIIRLHRGRLIVPTREEQTQISHRTTIDQGAYLAITTVENDNGELIGVIKIESLEDGTIDDITSSQLDDIVAMARIYLETNSPKKWWKLGKSDLDKSGKAFVMSNFNNQHVYVNEGRQVAI